MATIAEKANELRSLAGTLTSRVYNYQEIEHYAREAKALAQDIITLARKAERRICQHEAMDWPSQDYCRRPNAEGKIYRVREYGCRKCGKLRVRVTEEQQKTGE